jgi:hypothetical protein
MSAENRRRQSVEGMNLIGKKSPEASLVSLPDHINKPRRKGHELEKGHNHGLTGKCGHVHQTNVLPIAGARLGKELRPFIAMTARLVDFKQAWLVVDASGQFNGNVPIKARVKLNPSLFSVGIRFNLPFVRGAELSATSRSISRRSSVAGAAKEMLDVR